MNHISSPAIDILLATFNGERYLEAQLDSILAQTHQNFTVLIHDDGSSDNSVVIIQKYVSAHPSRFRQIEDGLAFKSASENFFHLMRFSLAPYVAFCDQDDIWLPNHLSDLLVAVRNLESEDGVAGVFSDLTVVDHELNVVHPSFLMYQRLNPIIAYDVDLLICSNVATGCAMMFNRPAREIALSLADKALMHDWCIALVCAKYGRCEYLPSSTILYRQHGDNLIGAKKFNFSYFFRSFRLSRIAKSYSFATRAYKALNKQRLSEWKYALIKTRLILDKLNIIPLKIPNRR